MRFATIFMLLTVVALCYLESASAQLLPERKLVRSGNEAFNNKEYAKSLELYNEALEVAPDCYEAQYNRANAYHHVMRESNGQDSTKSWEQSNAYFEDMINDPKYSNDQRAESLRNIGESLMAQEQYEAALNAFRESLLLNPNDPETKYNYVLAKRIVDQKRNQQGGGDNNQNQNQNQNQDQNQNQNQNKDQNQNQNQNQNGDGNNDSNEPNKDNQNGDNQNNGNNQGDDNRDGEDKQDNSDNGDGEDKQSDQQQDKNGQGDTPENQGDDGDDMGEVPQPAGLSDEQERLLDAIQRQEDETQEKLGEERKAIFIPGKKNW